MFTGVFNEMEPSEIAALMSCLVYDEKTDETVTQFKNERLTQALDILLDNAKKDFASLSKSQNKCR